jgi:16S rRNA (guanine527-N7)-methyltransferase
MEWDVIGPLFQEGLWAAKFYPADSVRHLDIGSGGGFPAIMLKILKPEIRLDMVESRAKKGIFLETAATALGFGATRVHTLRLEKFLQELNPNQSWDCISWKALKLGREDIEALLKHSHQSTQFWMFHGNNLAVDDPTVTNRFFRRFRTESLPVKRNWNLSIFLAK